MTSPSMPELLDLASDLASRLAQIDIGVKVLTTSNAGQSHVWFALEDESLTAAAAFHLGLSHRHRSHSVDIFSGVMAGVLVKTHCAARIEVAS